MIYTVDKEEFRIDKSVKVTRKEYNNLMNELYEFTESYIQFNGKTPVNDTVTITESDSNNKVINARFKIKYSSYKLFKLVIFIYRMLLMYLKILINLTMILLIVVN